MEKYHLWRYQKVGVQGWSLWYSSYNSFQVEFLTSSQVLPQEGSDLKCQMH